MRRAIDTNVLIYAHIPALEQHTKVRAFLMGQLANPDVVLVVMPMVLHEFVHVITDPRRFDPPVSMAEALATARLYLGRKNVECVTTDESAVIAAFELLELHKLGRRRIADALLLATFAANGVTELVTCNPQDFSAFEMVTLIDPSK